MRNIFDPDWHCKIDEGLSGVEHACWANDSRYLLTVAEFKTRLTVWDLKATKGEMNTRYIEAPKFAGKGIAFSAYQMALVRKHLSEDG